MHGQGTIIENKTKAERGDRGTNENERVREKEREREGSGVGDVEITFNPVSSNPLYLTEIRQHSKVSSPSSAVKQKTSLTFTSLPLHSSSDSVFLSLFAHYMVSVTHAQGLRTATPKRSQYP